MMPDLQDYTSRAYKDDLDMTGYAEELLTIKAIPSLFEHIPKHYLLRLPPRQVVALHKETQDTIYHRVDSLEFLQEETIQTTLGAFNGFVTLQKVLIKKQFKGDNTLTKLTFVLKNSSVPGIGLVGQDIMVEGKTVTKAFMLSYTPSTPPEK